MGDIVIVIYLLATIFGWVYILRWWSRKQQAGELLLVLGRPDGRLFGSLLGSIGVIAPFIVGLALGFLPITIPVLLSSSAFLTVGIYWFICGWSKLQIRENGILDFTGLLKWQDIASYSWDGRYGNVLVITNTSAPEGIKSVPFLQSRLSNTIYLFWASRIAVYLSPPQKVAVNSILAQFIAVDQNTPITNLPHKVN